MSLQETTNVGGFSVNFVQVPDQLILRPIPLPIRAFIVEHVLGQPTSSTGSRLKASAMNQAEAKNYAREKNRVVVRKNGRITFHYPVRN